MQPANTTKQDFNRDGRGRFTPGRSGNPAGRPAVATEIRDLARQHGPHAITRLVELSRSRDGATAVNACRALLDRGYGRPEQAIAVTTPQPFDGEPVSITDPLEASSTYERIVRGELAAEAVRFESAALPPPSPPPEPLPQGSNEHSVSTTPVGLKEPAEDPRIAPLDDTKALLETWGRL